MLKLPLSFIVLFAIPLFASWNNNYSFFSADEGGHSTANATLNILSMLLVVFGFFLFLYSTWKILGSNDPQDKTRGALLANIFFFILSLLFMANEWVINNLFK